MREHYNLDRLVEYNLTPVSDTSRVVNTEYRRLDGQVRSRTAILSRKLARFGALSLEGNIDPKKVGEYQKKKADMQEKIRDLQTEVTGVKEKRTNIAHYIRISELPEEDCFRALSAESRHLIDTVTMVSCRAETAMAHVLRERCPAMMTPTVFSGLSTAPKLTCCRIMKKAF